MSDSRRARGPFTLAPSDTVRHTPATRDQVILDNPARFALSRCLRFTLFVWVAASVMCPGSCSYAAAPAQQQAPPKTRVQPQGPQVYALPPARADQAIAYARARHELYFADFAYGILVLLLLLRWRVAPVFRGWAERAGPNRLLQAAVFAPAFLLTLDLLSLPGGMAAHRLARRYGQSIQPWGSWLWDWAKGELLALALGIFLLWLLYAVLRASPRRWWLYAWLASLPILVFVIFLTPLVVEPLFFHFAPLATTRPELAAELERVVLHAGQNVPESRMYVMDASSKVNTLNAYVTGLGASRRVVVWDTTLARMTTPEILFVFGHEMGHYVLGHIRDGIVFAAVLLFFVLFGGSYVFRWAVDRWGSAWSVRGADDWASFPVLVLLVSIFSFLLTPIDNAYSRHLEHQADQYGLEVVHDIVPDVPATAAESFQILGEVDLEEVSPSWPVKIWFYDHPPVSERIVFARTYDPWAKGESPEFVK
jgi:STE24 endopeptidase